MKGRKTLMKFFQRRIAEGMKDPEYRAAREEALAELKFSVTSSVPELFFDFGLNLTNPENAGLNFRATSNLESSPVILPTIGVGDNKKGGILASA